ncbi:hypothetical protein EBZ70_11820 [bacterium]|nr:hypothetical protein [bacterium]
MSPATGAKEIDMNPDFVDIHTGIQQIKALKTELALTTRVVRDQARLLARQERAAAKAALAQAKAAGRLLERARVAARAAAADAPRAPQTPEQLERRRERDRQRRQQQRARRSWQQD